jgi:hypothetical protein
MNEVIKGQNSRRPRDGTGSRRPRRMLRIPAKSAGRCVRAGAGGRQSEWLPLPIQIVVLQIDVGRGAARGPC